MPRKGLDVRSGARVAELKYEEQEDGSQVPLSLEAPVH